MIEVEQYRRAADLAVGRTVRSVHAPDDWYLKGGTTDPAGVQVAVKRGQPVVLDIDADAAGQIHVHSTPEHLIAFPEGRSQAGFTIDRPGIVDVEDHTLDELIVQLEVS